MEQKEGAVWMFNDVTFNLHKWNSNAKELEPQPYSTGDDNENLYATLYLGIKLSESKML